MATSSVNLPRQRFWGNWVIAVIMVGGLIYGHFDGIRKGDRNRDYQLDDGNYVAEVSRMDTSFDDMVAGRDKKYLLPFHVNGTKGVIYFPNGGYAFLRLDDQEDSGGSILSSSPARWRMTGSRYDGREPGWSIRVEVTN